MQQPLPPEPGGAVHIRGAKRLFISDHILVWPNPQFQAAPIRNAKMLFQATPTLVHDFAQLQPLMVVFFKEKALPSNPPTG